MTKSLAVIISPNYQDYAKMFLADCLQSLEKQTFQDFDIFLIDNETSDESYSLLQTLAPRAQIIRCADNKGFAGGNNLALKEILKADYQFVFLVNMDTVIDPDCLHLLLKAADLNTQAGALQARLMLHPQTELVNSLGNETHFLGFGYAKGYLEKYTGLENNTSQIAYPSGAAVLLRTDVLQKVGLFDEEMWMYNEDQDLGWRIWLAGYRCLVALDAIVYHKYEFNRSIQKYYWMDRNRIITIIKNYHWLTLLLILPAFMVMEIGLTVFSLESGWFKDKLKVWKYFLSKQNWKLLLQKRRQIQSSRIISERKIASLVTGKIWYQEIGSWKLRVANPFFQLYWWFVKKVIIW